MKILFITSGSIGDAVMSTSLLGYLAGLYPEAHFTIAAGPAAAPLFEAFPQLERLIVIRKAPWKKHWLALWRAVRGTHWDLTVDIRGSLLGYCLLSRKRKIFHKTRTINTKLEQLASLFNLSPPPPTTLWVSEDNLRKAKTLLPQTPCVVLIPKSNAVFKDWPLERFIELTQRLLKNPATAQTTFVILGVASQQEALMPLVEAIPTAHLLNLIGRTDLPLASAIIKLATLVISGDSGLLHITGALGTPMVGLYGPTNDKIYAPRGPHIRIVKVREFAEREREIQDESLIKKLSVDTVEAAVHDLLSNAAISGAA